MNETRYGLSDSEKLTLVGDQEVNLKRIEDELSVSILSRQDGLIIRGEEEDNVLKAIQILDRLRLSMQKGSEIDPFLLSHLLGNSESDNALHLEVGADSIMRNRFGQSVQARTNGQVELIQAVNKHDIVFANGPAGTGKTFLAVALAVAALEEKRVEKICLVRPAVEAGENLGFLPGDLREKIAPYLRPIYDSLQELLPKDRLRTYHDGGAIEIAPLAYMRGRTLKRSFVILDEAQNTTIPQMKMFLTRIGTHSKVIITGDESQVDLGPKLKSGFSHALQLLSGIPEIGMVHLRATEVLRHPLVSQIIQAYENDQDEIR